MNTYIQSDKNPDTMRRKLRDFDFTRFHEIWLTIREPEPPRHPAEHESLCLWRKSRTLVEGLLENDAESESEHREAQDRHCYLWIVVELLGQEQVEFHVQRIKERLREQHMSDSDDQFPAQRDGQFGLPAYADHH